MNPIFAVLLHVVFVFNDNSVEAATYVYKTYDECQSAAVQFATSIEEDKASLGIKKAFFRECDEFSVDTADGLADEPSI